MVRENAMKLFSACMERVLWKHRREMWQKVHNVLLSLYLRMSEDSPSVVKVSGARGGGLAAGPEAGGEEPAPIPCLRCPAGCPGSPDGRVRAAVVGRAARSGARKPELEDQSLPGEGGLRAEAGGGRGGGEDRGRGRLTEPRGLSSFGRTENGWRSVCRGAGTTWRTPRRRCARRPSDSSVSCPPPPPQRPRGLPSPSPGRRLTGGFCP